MDPRWPLAAPPYDYGGADGRKRSLEAAEGGGRPGKLLHRPGIAAMLGLSEAPPESIHLPLGGSRAVGGSSGLAGLTLVGGGVGAAGPTTAMALGGGAAGGLLQQPPQPPIGPGSEQKWVSASLTAAAALLEREPDVNPLPASALLPIPRAPPPAAADARAPAASLGLSAPGAGQAHNSWSQIPSALVSQQSGLRVGGGGGGVSGGGRLGPAEGLEALFPRKAGDGGRQDSSAVGAVGPPSASGKGKGKATAVEMGMMGVGSRPLHRSGGSVGSSSSDLSGAQPSKGLSVMARTIVDGIAALPLEQRAEVILELNRLYPQYAIPPVPSLPSTALPAITAANLPGTLPDGRSQKTCTLCGQVGHNSRSRYCPKRAGDYPGASVPKR